MTFDQVDAALAAGISAFEEILTRRACDVIAIGEMGIGNTTSASAIVGALTDTIAQDVVGRGTGINDARLDRKIAVVKHALDRFSERDWRSIARQVGGFEILGLTGVILAAARHRVPVVLDGFIVAASALLAYKIAPAARDYLICAPSFCV